MSKNTGKRVDVAAREGTSKSQHRQTNESEAQVEFGSQTSSIPLSLKKLRRGRTTSSEPPINVTDQDLRNVVQLLARLVIGKA